MKATIILFILAISHCSFGQSIKGVDFDEAAPYDELTTSDFMTLKGLFLKDKDGNYMWMWNVTTVGYARSLEKIRDLLEANEYGQTPDRDRSIIPNSVSDVFTEYNTMVHYCEMEEAEVLMYWYIHEDWVLGWIVNNLFAAASLIPMSEELERQRPTELERQQLEQERIERERQQQADRIVTGGGLGDGISFGGLGSRRARGSLPIPNMSGCDLTQKIEVKVEVQVNRNGNVISAIVASSTYQNKCIWDMVVDAAKKSKFSVDQSANYRQTGWIRYIIVP
jgi:hypothetical protein